MKKFYMQHFATVLFMLVFSLCGYGQIPVTITNPTNTTPNLSATYSSLASALSALNSVTSMSGPVVLTCTGGNSETAPATGLIIGSASLNAVLSSVNTITINKTSGSVTLNAGVGTSTPGSSTPDGILKLVGADYVTIDGLTITDGNTTNPATMEFGIALFKRVAGDGCNNNTIQNCIFNMQRVNNATGSAPMVDGSVGILVINSIPTAATTTLTPTNGGTLATNGTNSFNRFYANSFFGGNYGIALSGYAASSGVGPAPVATTFLGDLGNDIGGASSSSGNTILNFGGGASTNPSAGIRANNQWGITISNNTLNNNNGSGVNHANTLRGIYAQAGTSASATISYNTVTLNCGATTSSAYAIDNGIGGTALSNTINLTNNTISGSYPTASTGSFYGLQNTATAATVNINNNSVSNITTAGTGTIYCIYNSATATYLNYLNNTIGTITKSGIGTIYGLYVGGSPTVNCQNNTVDGLSCTAASSTGSYYGYYTIGSSAIENISNNIFRNFTSTGTATHYGIRIGSAAGAKTIQNNQIYNFSVTGGGSLYGLSLGYGASDDISGNAVYTLTSTGGSSSTSYGLYIAAGTTNNIYKNKIYDLSGANAGSSVYGIYLGGGTTNNLYNNYVGDLRATTANAAIPVVGIYASSGTTDNLYYNTVYLNATSTGALFGTAAIYSSTTPTLNLRNNIFVNTSTPAGATGFTAAYRRTGTALTNYASTSNNNLFYAGTGTNNVIFYDGTNYDATLLAYKTRVTPRDNASISENPNWASTTGSSTNYLHINPSIATGIESGAINISSYTDDFDGNIRYGNPGYSGSGSAPDIGADEFEGIPLPICAGTPAASTINGAASICYNLGTTLSLSTTYTELGITYQWASSTTPGGPYSNLGTAASQSTGNLTNTTYYICTITCTNSGQSYVTAEKILNVNALPTVTVSPTSAFYCSPVGSAVSITASGAVTYLWSPAAGLDVTSGSTVNASPTNSTTYTVTGTDGNGCVNTATSVISVGQNPVISSVTATPSAICAGNTSQLQVNIPASTVNAYTFTAGTGTTLDPMTGATTVLSSSDDDTPNASPQNIGFSFTYNGVAYTQYSVSPDGWLMLGGTTAVSQYTNAVTSTTNIPKLYPYWDDLATGTTGSVKTLVIGSAPYRIFIAQWNVTIPRNTSGAANSTFQAWLYETSGIVEFRYGTLGSGSMTASVGLTGDATHFNSITISSNSNSTSSANDNNSGQPATGTIYTFTPPQYSYLWSPESGLIPSANVSNPVTPSLNETTTFSVTVTNGGCSSSSNVTVSLASPLSAAVNSPSRCSADAATALTAVPTGGAPSFTFTWEPVEGLYTDAAATIPYSGSPLTQPTVYTTSSSTQNYGVTITDNCGTTATAQASVTVFTTPSASAGSNSPICSGNLLEFTGTSDIGTTFNWTGPNGFTATSQNPSIPSATIAASGTYSFVATADGCPSASSSVSVTVNQTPLTVTITPATPSIPAGSLQQLVAGGGSASPTILSENFNGSAPTWVITNGSSSPSACNWYYPATPYTDGSGSATFSNFSTLDGGKFAYSNSDAGGSGSTTDTKLSSPTFSTVGFTSATITYEHAYRSYTGDVTVAIEISTNGGTTWNVLKSYKGTSVGNTANNSQTTVNESISLSSYLNQSTLKIRFNYVSAWGYYWIIDNVVISGTPNPVSFTWSPTSDLFTDPDATIPYTGEATPTVYAKPLFTKVYTATATSAAGCSNAGNVTLVVNQTSATWTGSASNDWFNAANWSTDVPVSITNVVIPGGLANYPTLTAPAACNDLTIKSGVTGTGSILGNNNLTVNGTTVVERYLTKYAATNDYMFHFLSSPVSAQSIVPEFQTLSSTTTDFYKWGETTNEWINTLLTSGWNPSFESAFGVGTGYLVAYPIDLTKTFTGILNDGDVSPALSNTPGQGNGWNLVGNPYPSAIDWDLVTGSQYADLDNAVYVWDNANQSYKSWVAGAGSLTDGIIPSMQGFFVKANAASPSLTMKNVNRVHGGATYYKNTEVVQDLVSLRVEGNNHYDDAFVRFNNQASTGFDSQLDAYKLSGGTQVPNFFSLSNDTKYSVNTLPMSSLQEPVTLNLTVGADATYTLRLSGNTLSPSIYVTLEDLKTGTLQRLNSNPVYTFNAATGDDPNRFRLHFKDATSVSDPDLANAFTIYSVDGNIVILSDEAISGKVQVIDMAGRTLATSSLVAGAPTRINLNHHTGVYIVNVITSKGTFNHKILVN